MWGWCWPLPFLDSAGSGALGGDERRDEAHAQQQRQHRCERDRIKRLYPVQETPHRSAHWDGRGEANAQPTPANVIPCATTSRSMRVGLAPRAVRMPNSCMRCETVYARTCAPRDEDPVSAYCAIRRAPSKQDPGRAREAAAARHVRGTAWPSLDRTHHGTPADTIEAGDRTAAH